MRKLFSREMLSDIHIRLDRECLGGLTEKEISVLLSETIYNSSTFVVDQITERLTVHAEKQTDRVIEHIDTQTAQLIGYAEKQTDCLVQHIDTQTAIVDETCGASNRLTDP